VSANAGRVEDQSIGAECFLVEEYMWLETERAIEIFVDVFGIRRNVDAEFFYESFPDGAVRGGTFNPIVAAKSQAKSVAPVKLVALGMAPEVIMIFKNEDACLFSSRLAKKMSSRESTDSAADYNQIVRFARIC